MYDPTRGQHGYVPNPQATEAVIASLPHPTFSSASPELVGDDDRDAFCWRALNQISGGPVPPRNQGNVGSCVGNGTATGCDITEACQLVYQRAPQRWVARSSADGMYGLGRELSGNLGWGDGSYGGAAAKAVQFGVIHMLKYGDVDLTEYSASRCKLYGSRGVPQVVKDAAKLHPCKSATLITSPEEARAALQNGYGVNCCSGQGFASTRDKDGFARASGSWSHSMAWVGYRGGSRRGFLIWNSWGPSWISGPKYPDDQPDGSFWCDWDTVARMISGRDTFAYSNYIGFPRQDIDWSGFFNI